MKEKDIFILLVGLFLGFYFLPVDNETINNAILSAFNLLHEYARQHILTCLVPAFFIAGAIAVFIKKEVILKYLGGKTKKHVSYAIAAISGSLLAVCSCTILPLFAGIKKRGAGLGPAITFLFSGPAINIAAIFLTISVLGYQIGIARIISAILLSIVVGISMEIIFKEKTEEGKLYIQESKKTNISKPTLILFLFSMVMVLVVNGLQIDVLLKYILMLVFVLITGAIAAFKIPKEESKEWLLETWNFSKTIVPYLFIGVFVAGFIMPLLPQDFIKANVGSNSIFANLIASIFGAFMYFSTLTEIPILEALIAKGMSNGPALALLLAGPSLSFPSMLTIRNILGTKKTVVYVILVIIYSTIAGLIFGKISAI
jgi:uncharacterized membrane protein YraQ (UPF0718 family)